MRSLFCGLTLLLTVLGDVAHAANSLAIIVAPARGNEKIDRNELSLIFRRQKTYWPDGKRIQPANLTPASAERTLFSLAVFGLEPAALDEYWRERYFHGIRPPYVVASTEAMLRFIAETPNAVGYVDACAADGRVAVLAFLNAQGMLLPAATARTLCKSLQ